MSLRPNRAAAAAGNPPAYGGYGGAAGGYNTGGYSAPPGSGGGTNYYQGASSPYGGGGGYNNGAYGGGGGGGYNAGGSGYNTGGQQQSSSSSYGGYAGGTPVYGSSGGGSSSFKDKPKKRKSGMGGGSDGVNMVAILLGVLSVLFLVATVHFRGQRNKLLKEMSVTSVPAAIEVFQTQRDDLKSMRKDKTELQQTERRLQTSIKNYERDIKKCRLDLRGTETKHTEVTLQLEEHKEAVGEETERLTNRDTAWKSTIGVLQTYTQRESKRQAMERFGPGPHHVRFSVLLPSDRERKPRHFVVECAPLDLMPHAVHLFLEQVMHGLWNNAWFYLNGPHVIQGGPQAEDEGGKAVNRFKELSLDTLAFPEYSPEFPHVQFTLGFTGRPGGPDFYINKMNNTEAHGPGGQHQHHLEEFADPCFAKVIDGFETLEMIYQEQTFPDGHEWGWFFVHPVHIVGATLLEQTMPPPEEAESIVDMSKEPENQNPFPERPLHIAKLDEIEHQVVP